MERERKVKASCETISEFIDIQAVQLPTCSHGHCHTATLSLGFSYPTTDGYSIDNGTMRGGLDTNRTPMPSLNNTRTVEMKVFQRRGLGGLALALQADALP